MNHFRATFKEILAVKDGDMMPARLLMRAASKRRHKFCETTCTSCLVSFPSPTRVRGPTKEATTLYIPIIRGITHLPQYCNEPTSMRMNFRQSRSENATTNASPLACDRRGEACPRQLHVASKTIRAIKAERPETRP
eukprot:TRINITY_DN10623_c0_g2_i2.p2 TRINITY_DN10623_c0_g2~~TRINITY_DN10623_c0_g2_i2.p2  ORF type:complete len:137 (+),score=5.94 TRINITY_DN10623_c0_g2_i2:229-639(+)